MGCVSLRERFGRRYRIGWEANGATKGQWPEAERPWLMEVRCRYGRVYPQGGDVLAAVTDRRIIGRKLRALPCVLTARGDEKVRVTFHVDHAAPVFALLKPYRRRQVSEAERERLRALGVRFRFRSKGELDGTESDFSALESTNGPINGSRTVPADDNPESLSSGRGQFPRHIAPAARAGREDIANVKRDRSHAPAGTAVGAGKLAGVVGDGHPDSTLPPRNARYKPTQRAPLKLGTAARPEGTR